MRSTVRLLIALLITTLIGGGLFLASHYHQGGAEDILSMHGVQACSTQYDSTSGKHSCPAAPQFVTTCQEALEAVGKLDGIVLRSEVDQLLPTSAQKAAECGLRAVDKDKGLFAVVVRAYVQTDSSVSAASFLRTASATAAAGLYAAYSNFYAPFLTQDLSAVPVSGIAGTGTSRFQPFSPAFLIQGEPGFRMSVKTIDQNGANRPGALTLIRVACGSASDTMVAELGGNSWFSYDGFQKLDCGSQPLTASVVVPRDDTGNWVAGTPSYSYLYEPAVPVVLSVQNRRQPSQLSFLGKWQGVGALVQSAGFSLGGGQSQSPVAGAQVSFVCAQASQTPAPSPALLPPTASTDKKGRAAVALADALATLPGCSPERIAASLASSDSTYDFLFPATQIAAGRISGATLEGGTLQGYQPAVGGTVRLASVGGIPGGVFAEGSQACLFYNAAAAQTDSGCPSGRSAAGVTLRVDSNGQYLFGANAASRISYGDYLRAGAGAAVVRIVNYKGIAYEAGVAAGNPAKLDPAALAVRDITLPTGQKDLQDHICQAVNQFWDAGKECDPLISIVTRESRFDVAATNPSSGACGLFQSNPCSKYAETALAGENYQSIGNQIRWGVGYIKDRYGTPSAAWTFWQGHGHY